MRFAHAALVIPIALGFALGLDALAAATHEQVTLQGSYVWEREDKNHTGDLEAVLTHREADEWAVAFHFVWEGEPRLFEGTAHGSVETGTLEGKVESDDESHKLTFQFRGNIEDGAFRGTHGYFKRDGSLQGAGTLTLERVP